MKISIITPTRNRQEQLSLVIDCVNNQTRKPDEWIIVDDGPEPVPQEIINKISVPYVYHHYRSGLQTSTCANTAKCLELANADQYIFFDDDDYYPKNYIENFSKLLTQDNVMVGNGRWIDYRLSTGYYRIRLKTQDDVNKGIHDCMVEWHGSGIRGETLKENMIKVLKRHESDLYNDVVCFKALFKNGMYKCLVEDFGDFSAISLKDYRTGNKGIIEAHRSNKGMQRDDDSYTFFKHHLGEDWIKYKKYLGTLR